MEKRRVRVIISAAGGTAGRGAKTCKLPLPSGWMAAMGITEDDREVELSFDGESITVSRPMSPEEFLRRGKELGHDMKTLLYWDRQKLCTKIAADFTDRTLRVENCTDNPVKTAFGKNALPLWEDLMLFLEERCIPRQRAGLREYLETLGLEEYDPMEIIRRTQGRMAEDEQWLEVF